MKENQKKKTVIAGAAVIVICIAVFALLAGGNSSAKRIAELLDLGNKYLMEQNYEEAVVAFQEAIAIDPKCEEAYLGLADVYIAMDDYESAIDILQQGMVQTGSEELAAYLEESEKVYIRIQEEVAEERESEEIKQEKQKEEKSEEAPKEEAAETGKNALEYFKEGAYEEYDENGNLVKKSYWEDSWKTYFYDEYDVNGNLVKRSYWSDWLQVFIEEIYDERGLLIIVNQYEADGSDAGGYEYEYDANGNCVREITNYVAGGKSVKENEYDAEGNIVRIIQYNPDGTIDYIYEH